MKAMSYPNDKRRDNSAKRQMHYSPNMLACVNNAIDNVKLASLEYDSRENEITHRIIEPMALVYKNKKRHLVGWCQLRNDWRSFRLDRIEMIKVSATSFEPREGFNLEDFEGDDDFSEQNNHQEEE